MHIGEIFFVCQLDQGHQQPMHELFYHDSKYSDFWILPCQARKGVYVCANQ